MVISVAPNYTKSYPSIAMLLVRSQLLFIFVSERPVTLNECCKSDNSIVKPSWLAEWLLTLKWIVEKKGIDLLWEISSRINSFYCNFPCVFIFCLKNTRNFYTLAARICHEWRCQGTTRRFRTPEHTKELIKKDSNRYFVKKLRT